MRVIRHPEVPEELEAAALWYEERQSGLGEDFLVEYRATLELARGFNQSSSGRRRSPRIYPRHK